MKIRNLYLQQIDVNLSLFNKKLYTGIVSLIPIGNRLRIRQMWTVSLLPICKTKYSSVNNSGNCRLTIVELSTCVYTRVEYRIISEHTYLKPMWDAGKSIILYSLSLLPIRNNMPNDTAPGLNIWLNKLYNILVQECGEKSSHIY